MKNETPESILRYNSHFSGPVLMNRSTAKNPHYSYKAALFGIDILLASFSFFLIAVFSIQNMERLWDMSHLAIVFIIAISSISLFKPCHLYNYHVIYNARQHLKQMALAWGCSALLLLLVYAILFVGDSASTVQLAIATGVLVVLLLFLRNYNEVYSAQLLVIFGLSFIFVGLLGIFGKEPVSMMLQSPLSILSGFVVTATTISISRYLIVHRLFSVTMRRKFRRQTIIVGSNAESEDITRYIIDTNAPFWIAGVVGKPRGFGKNLQAIKDNLGEIVRLPEIVDDNRISEVIVTDETIDKLTLIAIVDYCAAKRVNVWFPPSYMPVISIKLVIDRFCGRSMIRLGTQKNYWFFNKLKHGFDALVTVPLFLLQLPFFLAIAAAVKLTSRGPVFYKATAIGKGGRQFTMYKFRSMRQNSDCTVHKTFVTQLIKGEIGTSDSSGQAMKITNDDRITSIGRLIRKYSLDELPQLINVIKGDMSLVGPRPCLPYEYEEYEDWHKKRVAIRPGMTGLWQVTGRSEVSFEDMILLDLYYIYNRSFLMELNIFLETVFVVLHKKGAY